MKSFLWVVMSVLVMIFSCSRNAPQGYDLPSDCNGRCELVSDMNSFRDAVANSAAHFSNCICLEKGVVEGEITVSKPLKILGRNDGTSVLGNISFRNAENVLVSNVTFKNKAVKDSAMFISGSSVKLEGVTFSNISAGSLFGGRAVVVTGKRSEVIFENVKIDKTDGTGFLINGVHDIFVNDSTFSNCGFAGIWVQNGVADIGKLTVSDTVFNDNSSVSLQILGNYGLDISNSTISGVKKLEINMESVGDGIVIKNSIMDQLGAVTIKDVEISGFQRAGLIFDGINGAVLEGIEIKNLSLYSETGQFGAVVQNGKEHSEFRSGMEENPFYQNDIDLSTPLFILEKIQEM